KRRKLRVAIVTENMLPKVDGVTRTLARLLEHLNAEGHDAMVLGPETGVREYAGHPVVGTFGLPLIIYPGLKLNFTRPRFIRRLHQFKPDVVHFVDPIWLGAQMLPIVQKWLPDVPCVASYHTNLPTYAALFGMPWLESTMWKLTRALHSRCELTFCPSESTRSMLLEKGLKNVLIWSRGVDTSLFTPAARDENLRAGWGCSPADAEQRRHHEAAVQQAGVSAMAQKLGLTMSGPNGKRDESFIKTPVASPELSPPPAYESLAGIPDLPLNGFALPPPAFVHQIEKNNLIDASASSGEGKTVLLYVGRISWEKNIRLLIEAFKLLPPSVRSKAKLVVVGDGPARADLTRLSKKLGLDVAFMGHQKGTRLAAMYASSDISAFPSHTETFGQVVLEALACGLPVVGLHAQGTSDLVTHGRTGLLLDVAKAAKGRGVPGSPPRVAVEGRPLMQRSATDGRSPSMSPASKPARTTPGLPVPIPEPAEFATAMAAGTSAFTSCARSYSMHLERLILDRKLRMTMGRQAQLEAGRRTWWDAMDAVVCGYEEAIARRSTPRSQRLSDEELERLRDRQSKQAPLTGGWVKLAVLLLLILF
ncbi:UDP-Glycosyltransferase/glycogen phosphorylase, partial [Jaminaea rosea]